MRYLKKFEGFDRIKDVLLGKVKDWSKMSHDERVEYLNANSSLLEIEYQKVISRGATGMFGRNERVWYFFLILMIYLKDNHLDIVNEMKWRILNHENPIFLLREISNRIDMSELPEFYQERMQKIIDLGISLNPYVDEILFESKEEELKDDLYEVKQIFLSIFEDYDFIISRNDISDGYDDNYITYDYEIAPNPHHIVNFDLVLRMHIGKNRIKNFESLIPIIKHFIKLLSEYGYNPHILNTYQKKKKFGTELEDYLKYITVEKYNKRPLTIFYSKRIH